MASDYVLDGVNATCPGTAAGDLTATLLVPATHPILAGHFPGAPLVPGVLLLDAVARAYGNAVQLPHTLHAVLECRFLQPLAPEQLATLSATTAPGEQSNTIAIDGQWHRGQDRIASFRLVLRPQP
jgi:3-hydroxyacyl-[acyl-carrier-protein] dehydratase